MSKKFDLLNVFATTLTLGVICLCSPQLVQAATFNVTTNTEFQDALDTANTNNQDNSINLAAGTYTGPFMYDNSSGYALTVTGQGQNNTFVTAPTGNDGLVIDTNGALTISNLTFRDTGNNGITILGSAGTNTNAFILNIHNVTFFHNTSYGVQLGFWNGDQGGSVTVTDSIFDGNVVGFSLDGGSFAVPVTFSRNTVIHNASHGLFLHRTTDGSDMLIDHNYFGDNTGAWGAGFAAQADCNCKITATSNLIVNNTGTDGTAGVGVDLETNTSDVGGATLINFINNTVVHNTRADTNAGGLLVNSNTPNSVLNFYNNVFWDNQVTGDDNGLGADVYLNLSNYGTVHFSHNTIHSLEVEGDLTNYYATENLDIDPLFTGGSGAAYQTVDEGSRIVGTGTTLAPGFPTTDYAGNAWRGNPDRGAYSLYVKYAVVSPPNSPDSCTPVPVNIPDLFQINTSKDTATLFYTPSNEASNYQIAYGFNSNAEQFRVITNQGPTTGALSYTINSLPRLATMYFKVYSQNNCGQGQWSNIMAAKVQANKKYYRK